MIYPSINDIMKAKNIDSKYTLVVATAKRAREINQSKVTFTECKSDKAVTIALHEIYENKVNFKMKDKNSIKLGLFVNKIKIERSFPHERNGQIFLSVRRHGCI